MEASEPGDGGFPAVGRIVVHEVALADEQKIVGGRVDEGFIDYGGAGSFPRGLGIAAARGGGVSSDDGFDLSRRFALWERERGEE